MTRRRLPPWQVVDLFAGPGGLAEGFSRVRDADQERVFEIALSVEKEKVAHETLTLRSFCRQFPGALPHEYHAVLKETQAASLASSRFQRIRDTLRAAHPAQWAKATDEARCLELGRKEDNEELDRLLEKLKKRAGDRIILIGGPPCQAYSLVGRARNKGIKGYVPAQDKRHFLYEEYIRILGLLKPAAFVMENVKGMLSASIEGQRLFQQIRADLEGQGYDLLPLAPRSSGGRQLNLTGTAADGRTEAWIDGRDFIIRAEEHGIPQTRHRVILVGIRRGLLREEAAQDHGRAEAPFRTATGRLSREPQVPLSHVLDGLPPVRSGLSDGPDSDGIWSDRVRMAWVSAAKACLDEPERDLAAVAQRLSDLAPRLRDRAMTRSDSRLGEPVRNRKLNDWLSSDPPDVLTHHDTRSHMDRDLERYAFAAAYGQVHRRSPAAGDFPRGLAPDHRNWESGKFADRFRVQVAEAPATTVTSHISKDGHYFIHPDPLQCRSLTVREAARIQTFPDNYVFMGGRTAQYVQVGNAVPPYLARQIGEALATLLEETRSEVATCV